MPDDRLDDFHMLAGVYAIEDLREGRWTTLEETATGIAVRLKVFPSKNATILIVGTFIVVAYIQGGWYGVLCSIALVSLVVSAKFTWRKYPRLYPVFVSNTRQILVNEEFGRVIFADEIENIEVRESRPIEESATMQLYLHRKIEKPAVLIYQAVWSRKGKAELLELAERLATRWNVPVVISDDVRSL